MKVTAVTTLSVDRFNYVKVETDEGLVGIGELHPASGTGGTPFLPIAGVKYCAEYLVGKDPLRIEQHWQHMFRRQLFRGGSDAMAALGAIDIALWDIKGKTLNKPTNYLADPPAKKCGSIRISGEAHLKSWPSRHQQQWRRVLLHSVYIHSVTLGSWTSKRGWDLRA